MKGVLIVSIYITFCFASFSQSTETGKDYLFDKGLFLDGQVSYRCYYGLNRLSSIVKSKYPDYAGLYFKMGNKWYFGTTSKTWRPGFQITWLKFGVMRRFGIHTTKTKPSIVDISLFDVGFANIYKINETSGLEFNFNTGVNSRWVGGSGGFIDLPEVYISLDLNAEIKYRINKYAIGFNYTTSIVYNYMNYTMHTVNLSVGRKF